MKKNIAVLAAACAGFAGAADPCAAATDIYMKITDPAIGGEATVKGYEGQIQLLSYSQSVQAPATQVTGSGAGAGRATCGQIALTKRIDKSSPLLVQAVMSSEVIKQAVISFVDTTNAGGRGVLQNDYTVTLTDVVFTGVQQSDVSPAELVESVTMVARKFEIDYVQFGQRGTGAPPVKITEDCSAAP